MAAAKEGDKVKVHYTGKLADGTVFDSSLEGEPLEFTIGEGKVIPGFEESVRGMQPGHWKNTDIPMELAYGPHRKDMVMVVERQQIPPGLEVKVGQRFQLRTKDSRQPLLVTITEVTSRTVTLDANHPLAGKDLHFYIRLEEIAGRA